jgi:hypothetical protein
VKSISLGDIATMYGLCGPDLGPVLGWEDVDEKSGPRCERCRKIIKETGENTYCGRYTPVAHIREQPETSI